MKKITRSNFQSDTLYPRVARATAELLAERKQVSPVGVFMKMGMLSQHDLDEWRMGRVPSLERVIQGSLGKVGRVLRILDRHARQLGLQPVSANYIGLKRGRMGQMRFSNSGERAIEEAYRRHFVPMHGWLSQSETSRLDPPQGGG